MTTPTPPQPPGSLSSGPPSPASVWATPSTGAAPAQSPLPYAAVPGHGVAPGHGGATVPLAPGPAGRDRTALWVAGCALLAGLVALAVAVVALVLALSHGPVHGTESAEPLAGEVVGVPPGSSLSGDRLAHSVAVVLADAGADVETLECDDTLSVQRGAQVDCSGTVDEYDGWLGTVTFTSADGEFELYEE